MKGRIVNPVTNQGIAGIKVYVTKPKTCLGYDGCGSKTIFETESDDEGYFTIEKRFRKSKTYTVSYGYDKMKYRLLEAQVSPAGTEYDGSNFEFFLMPLGFLKFKIQNINCFDSTDKFIYTQFYRLNDKKKDLYNSNYLGCYSYEFMGSVDGSPNGYAFAKMGWHVIEGIIIRNGIQTEFKDSIYVPENDFITWDINY